MGKTKTNRKHRYTTFLGETLAAERAQFMVPGKTQEFITAINAADDAGGSARATALTAACWLVQHGQQLKQLSRALGSPLPAGARDYYQVARAVVRRDHKPPRPYSDWPEAFTALSLRTLIELTRKARRGTPLQIAAQRAVKGLLARIRALDGSGKPAKGQQFVVRNLREMLAEWLTSGTYVEALLEITDRRGNALPPLAAGEPPQEAAA